MVAEIYTCPWHFLSCLGRVLAILAERISEFDPEKPRIDGLVGGSGVWLRLYLCREELLACSQWRPEPRFGDRAS